MNVTGSVSFVAHLGTARWALNPAGYCYSASRNYMIGFRSLGRSICNAASYPARGIRPCSAASSAFTVACPSVRSGCPSVIDSARPAAPPRPALLGLAANTCCSLRHSERSGSVHPSRAWAPGPLRGALGHSGMAAHTARPCFPECGACRALSNTGFKRTRIRGCSGRLSFTALHLSFYLPRAA